MYKLQFVTESDFQTLIDWSGDERFLLQWAGPSMNYPLDKKQLKSFLYGSNNKDSSDRMIYKAIESETGQMVGHISLGMLNHKHRTGRIGRVLVSPAKQGEGIGEWMMREVCQIGFEEFNLHRIGLGVFDFNIGAIRCYEKIGFQRDGLLREVVSVQGDYWNMIEMSLLENEWQGSI
ncbi:GNAT family protein [Bacillus tianshenii]|nr:GNAT family protein [Bacillus tianshenii]